MRPAALGAYRSDEIPRAHPLRRLRDDLRRNRSLRELTLAPLSAQGTAELAQRVLGARPSTPLAGLLHDRSGGLPFFVEELAGALESSGRLRPGKQGLELALDADVPLPQTIRDAVLLQTRDLTDPARATAEAASVAGTRFDLELVAALGFEAGLDELLARGLIVELEPGTGGLPAPARARCDLRGRPLAAPAFDSPQAGRGARGARPRSGRGRRALARGA